MTYLAFCEAFVVFYVVISMGKRLKHDRLDMAE